jgi:hypothetical protein
MSARGFVVTFALAVASWTTSAGADDSAVLVRTGIDRYVHQDYEAARVAFARAFDMAPSARTLFNLALAELESGHAVESVRHMRGYLIELDAEPDKVQALRTKWLPRAEALTSRLQIDAPPGAGVAVDGVPQGNAPLAPLDVAIGPHDVTVQVGAWSHGEQVTNRAGELLEVRFRPPTDAAVPSPGGAAGSASAVARPPSKGWPAAKRVTVITLGSSAVVGLALGVTFAVISRQEASEGRDLLGQLSPDQMQAQCTGSPLPIQCPFIEAHNRSAHDAYELSNVFYVAGGALAGATVLTALLWPSRASVEVGPAAARLLPIAGGDHVGLAVSGIW